jgi:hypothetical protein
MTYKTIVFTSLPIAADSTLYKKEAIQAFNSFEEFLLIPTDYPVVVFIIESDSQQYIHEILWKIRTHPKFFYFLCYANAAINKQDKNLIDGIDLSGDGLNEQVLLFEELNGSFKQRDEPLFRDDRLLKYLWVRPDFIIQPYHQWNQQRFYSYPLLDALGFNELDTFDWIKTLLLKKLLAKQQLVDRQRECSYCHSSHLSFVDICPNCSSLDIVEQVALHCFICGQVAPQDEFLKSGVLICPKCTTPLKHIGSDYDRPIENYSCNNCDHFFIEGQVLVRCSVCKKTSSTEELSVNEIYNLQISELGRITAIRGAISDVLAIFSGKNFVANEVFVHDLDWMMLLNDRYQELKFSVLGLYFSNLTEVINTTSQSNVLNKIEGIAERIRELLRDPDLCTRSSENVLWMLLPQTDEKGLTPLKSRLSATIETIQQTDSNQLKLICKYTEYLSSQRIKNESAELLLARLKGKII